MQDRQWNIIYAGLDINTFLVLLNEPSFKIQATAFIDKFKVFSINPVNYLFKGIYSLRINAQSRILEFFLAKIWKMLMPFSSGVFYKYRNFLYVLSINKVDVVDVDNPTKYLLYVQSKNIDVLITSVWPLLTNEVILAPKHKAINIHPSMLPKYRGSLPTLWSLRNRDTVSAVTYMIIDESMDTGNILAQYPFAVTPEDDWLSLEHKIAKIVSQTFAKDVKAYLTGVLHPFVQDKNIAPSKTATYDKYRKVSWQKENKLDIYNKINLYPFLDPGVFCFSKVGDKEINFLKTNKITELFPLKGEEVQPGDFKVSFPFVLACAEDGLVRFMLFRDLDFTSSLSLLKLKHGSFS